jgi:predicted nucleotidyltransferase
MDAKVQAQIDLIKNIIVETLPVEQIYLFGSYAYGTPHKDSDLDFYVVLNDEVQLRDIDAVIKIRKAIRDKKICRWIFWPANTRLFPATKQQPLSRKRLPIKECLSMADSKDPKHWFEFAEMDLNTAEFFNHPQ